MHSRFLHAVGNKYINDNCSKNPIGPRCVLGVGFSWCSPVTHENNYAASAVFWLSPSIVVSGRRSILILLRAPGVCIIGQPEHDNLLK